MKYEHELDKQNCWRCQGSLSDTPRDEIIDCDIYIVNLFMLSVGTRSFTYVNFVASLVI